MGFTLSLQVKNHTFLGLHRKARVQGAEDLVSYCGSDANTD